MPDGQSPARDRDMARGGLRVRFLDEEGRTARLLSADEPDNAAPVRNVHFLKSRSCSDPAPPRRTPPVRRGSLDAPPADRDLPPAPQCAPASGPVIPRSKNCNVYSVDQARTVTVERERTERRKSAPLANIPQLLARRASEPRSSLPAEGAASSPSSERAARALGRLSRGLGRLLRRGGSVRISEPDPVYKVAYLGNVLTGWARGDGCIEKPLATLWRNYQQSSKPDVIMKLSVTNSGLKGFTKEHGLTEYWAHRVTYCASPPHYPRVFCWLYRHEGKKLKHELRCHAALCSREAAAQALQDTLRGRLRLALAEFKKDRVSKQNARLSLAHAGDDVPSLPRRKLLLSVGAANYRPPLERSKSAPRLGAIEELCSEEDAAEAELCPVPPPPAPAPSSAPPSLPAPPPEPSLADEILELLARESAAPRSQLTDSDDGSVSSGCETASTLTSSDAEPAALPDEPQDVVSLEPLGERGEVRGVLRRRDTYPPGSTDDDAGSACSACSDESGYSELSEHGDSGDSADLVPATVEV